MVTPPYPRRAALIALAFALLLLGAACAPAPAAAPAKATAAPAASGATGGASAAPAASPPTAPEAGGATTAAAPAPATVKVGVVRTLTEAGIYIAMERGYFAEQGITLDLENFDTAAKAVPAVSTNQVDISSG